MAQPKLNTYVPDQVLNNAEPLQVCKLPVATHCTGLGDTVNDKTFTIYWVAHNVEKTFVVLLKRLIRTKTDSTY